jgi:hypothetical protein
MTIQLKRNLHFDNDKKFIKNLEVMRRMATTLIWICYSSCSTNCIFDILGELGVVCISNVVHFNPNDLKVDSIEMNTLKSCIIKT